MTGLRITPIRPIERGGLKGFGFSVHFGTTNSQAGESPALTPLSEQRREASSEPSSISSRKSSHATKPDADVSLVSAASGSLIAGDA